MEKFVKGDVVVVLFPFSDLSKTKRRPAIVITELEGEDVILCQITSKMTYDSYSIALENENFKEGSLKQKSNIRPTEYLLQIRG